MLRVLLRKSISALRQLAYMLRTSGVLGTLSIIFFRCDDRFLRSFDRRHNVRTSGFLQLGGTGFDPSRLPDATQYAPVNGYGFRKLLRRLALPREWKFVDFGCGLARPCLLAAEYGFARVRGVELASDLCAGARQNAASFRPLGGRATPVEILQMDVLEYCASSDDDVFFLFRPFALAFMLVVIDRLAERSRELGKPFTIIYSERDGVPGSHAPALAAHRALEKLSSHVCCGQAFHLFRCGGKSAA